jgi:hypothetical protein
MLAFLETIATPICCIAFIFSRIILRYSLGEQLPEAIMQYRRAIVSVELVAI